jgi:hypothetical protein
MGSPFGDNLRKQKQIAQRKQGNTKSSDKNKENSKKVSNIATCEEGQSPKISLNERNKAKQKSDEAFKATFLERAVVTINEDQK